MNIDQISNNISPIMVQKWKTAVTHIDNMMKRRGFHFEQQLELLFFQYKDASGESNILCIFPNEKLSIETLREIIQFCENQKTRNIILILQHCWSANCKKIFENLTFFSLELFYLKEFQYDLTQLYYYVPHEKIKDKKEVLQLKKLYGNALPVLLKTDMVARYFGYQRGDLVRICRKDFGVPTICYRQVK